MSVNPIRLPGVLVLTVFFAAFPAMAEDPPATAPIPAAASSVAPTSAAATETPAAPGNPAAAVEIPLAPAGDAKAASGTLPRDLSAWNMFRSADHIVKGVILGLALASVLTWTVALAKFIELWLLKRKLLPALGRLEGARSLSEAQGVLGDRGPAAALSHAA